jgi:hypothetical protein
MGESDWQDHAQRDRRWRSPFTWTTLIALGWVAYELTAQPGLGAFIVCAKFGWNDLRTAFWLRRIDPDRRRGRTCFWLYLASGMWKVAVTGSVLMYLLDICVVQLQVPLAGQAVIAARQAALAGAGLAALCGFVLSSLATFRALWGAYRNGLRLWLSAGLHRARRARVWPSLYPDCGSQNRFTTLAYTALIFGWLACFPLIGALLIPLDDAVDGRVWGGVMGLAILAFMIGSGSGAIHIRDRVLPRLVAGSPGDCWAAVDWEALRWETGVDLDFSNAPSPAG